MKSPDQIKTEAERIPELPDIEPGQELQALVQGLGLGARTLQVLWIMSNKMGEPGRVAVGDLLDEATRLKLRGEDAEMFILTTVVDQMREAFPLRASAT